MTQPPHPVAQILGSGLTWLAGLWGVFAGLVLSLATTFFAESGPRVGGHVLSVGVGLAAVLLPALVVTTACLAQSGWVGLAPWSGWLVGTVVLGTKTGQGSLLLLGDAQGNTVLYVGALLGAITVGFAGTRRSAKRPALPVRPVGDGDAEPGEGVSQPV